MLKIQFAVTHSAPGGLLELWNDISEGLAARGHMVQRFGIYPELSEPAPGPAWLHIGAARPRTPLAGIRTFFKLMSFLRRERPDAIVTGMPAANVIIPLAAFLSGVSTKVIATHHSPIETHNPKLNSLDNLTGLLPNVHAIMSVSNTVAGSLSSKSRRYLRKSHTIRNALPGHIERLLATLASAPPRIASKDRRVVALGRLAYQKNYPMLISAIARLPNTHLAIAGGGEDEASLRQQAMDEGSADRIDFLGYLSREEALREAAKADIFVQVSHFEGHSLALIEAARLGLPLIVSDVPVQVEGVTAKDGTCCGLIVPLGDVQGLSNIIDRLLSDPISYRFWAERALKLGRDSSNSQMIDDYEQMIRSAAGQSATSKPATTIPQSASLDIANTPSQNPEIASTTHHAAEDIINIPLKT